MSISPPRPTPGHSPARLGSPLTPGVLSKTGQVGAVLACCQEEQGDRACGLQEGHGHGLSPQHLPGTALCPRREGQGPGRLAVGAPQPALLLQTELLPRCGEIPPVGQVVHDEGKVLLQAVLEVSGGGSVLGGRLFPEGCSEARASAERACPVCHRASVAKPRAASWTTSPRSSSP